MPGTFESVVMPQPFIAGLPSDVVGTSINKLKGPQIDFCRPDYKRMISKWILIEDVLEGQQTVKEKGSVYLPVPRVTSDETENSERYKAYRERALFYNVTKRTLAGLVGEVFTTDPVLDLPTELEPLRLDVDGGGVTIDQQARMTLARVLALGRCGLYTDYPTTTQTDENGNQITTASQKDVLDGRLRPVIYCHHPSDIINWRIELVDSRRLLTLVVIREAYVAEDDGFEEKTAIQFRALRLRRIPGTEKDLEYYQQIYRKDATGNFVQFGDDIIPTDFHGKPFDEILFTFVGADNNDPSVTDPPMYDLACVNIAHYRNSADYEETCFMLGNPTPYFTGLTKEWVKDVLKGTIMLGSRAAIPLPVGADAGLLQVEANTMVLEAMKHKEDLMRGIGAKLVDVQHTTKTATQDNHESAEDSSVLAVCAVNVSTAYSACLKWAARFVGTNEAKVEYNLNTDFSMARLSFQERAQLMAEWNNGAISWEEYRFRLHRANVAYLEDSKAKDEIAKDAAANAANEIKKAGDLAKATQVDNPAFGNS
jgi:hypothetical protein